MKDLNQSLTATGRSNDENKKGGPDGNGNTDGGFTMMTTIPGKTSNIMQLERVNVITDKFERLLNTALVNDYSLDGKIKQALSDIN